MKPYGKLTVYGDDVPSWDRPSDHETYGAPKRPASRFEVHESIKEDSDETLSLIFALVKNLSLGVDTLSDKVQQSMRFFDVERIERELFSHNEQFLKNLIQAQTTVIVDRVISGLSNKVTEGLSGHLAQVLNQEKKSSELLLNALNHRFRSLDERCDKLDHSILAYTQKIEMKLARVADLESARNEAVPASRHNETSFRNASAVRTSAPRKASPSISRGQPFSLHKSSFSFFYTFADWMMGSGLRLLSNPAMILLLIVLCLVGFRISMFFPRHSVSYTTQSARAVPQKRVIPVKEKEDLDLALKAHEGDEESLPHGSREFTAGAPPIVAKDIAALGDLFPKTRELSPLREAVLSGDSLAIYEMGVRFLSGTGVKRAPDLAIRFFEKAVDYNSPFAAYQLASQYEKGVGVARDVQKSLTLYEQAANAGHVKAMHNLGVLIAAGGVGGKPDYGKAIEWFQKAADHGLKDSQYNLGLLLAHGLGGPQDRVEAYKWFDLASQQNDAESLRKRDMVAKKMSATDIALARVRASQWRAKTSPLTGVEGASVLPWSNKNGLPVNKENRRS